MKKYTEEDIRLAISYEEVLNPISIQDVLQIIESNLVNEGLKGNLNPTLSIFTLKNKHNWNDGVNRTALTDTQGNDIKTDITKLSDEELRTIAELQRKSRISS